MRIDVSSPVVLQFIPTKPSSWFFSSSMCCVPPGGTLYRFSRAHPVAIEGLEGGHEPQGQGQYLKYIKTLNSCIGLNILGSVLRLSNNSLCFKH